MFMMSFCKNCEHVVWNMLFPFKQNLLYKLDSTTIQDYVSMDLSTLAVNWNL